MEIESTFKTYPLPIKFINHDIFELIFSDLKTKTAKNNLLSWFRNGSINKDSTIDDIFNQILQFQINENEKSVFDPIKTCLESNNLLFINEDSHKIAEKIKEYVEISTCKEDDDDEKREEKKYENGKKEENIDDEDKQWKMIEENFSSSSEIPPLVESSEDFYPKENENENENEQNFFESENKCIKKKELDELLRYVTGRLLEDFNEEYALRLMYIKNISEKEKSVYSLHKRWYDLQDDKEKKNGISEFTKRQKFQKGLQKIQKRFQIEKEEDENECKQEKENIDDKDYNEKCEFSAWKIPEETFSSSLDIPPLVESREVYYSELIKNLSLKENEDLHSKKNENEKFISETQKKLQNGEKLIFIRKRLLEDFNVSYDRHLKGLKNPGDIKEEFLDFLYETWNNLQKDEENRCGYYDLETRRRFEEEIQKIDEKNMSDFEEIKNSMDFGKNINENFLGKCFSSDRIRKKSEFLKFQKEKEEFEKKKQEFQKEKEDFTIQKEKAKQLAKKRREEFKLSLKDMEEDLKEVYEEHERYKEEMNELEKTFLDKKKNLEDMYQNFNIDTKKSSFEKISDINLYTMFLKIFEKLDIKIICPLKIVKFRKHSKDRDLISFVEFLLDGINPDSHTPSYLKDETKKIVEVYKTIDCLLKTV